MKSIGILAVYDSSAISNQQFSYANEAWYSIPADLELRAYKEPSWLNVDEYPDAPLLDEADIEVIPTILYVEVQGDQATKVLSRLEGSTSYNQVYNRYIAHLENPDAIFEGDGQVLGQRIRLDRIGYWLGFGIIDFGWGAFLNILILIILFLILMYAFLIVMARRK